MSTIPGVDIDALKAKLNSIAQDINLIPTRGARGTTEDAGKCLSNLSRYLEGTSEQYGAHPQDILGQHVCCNVVVLVLDRIVKPSLTSYCQYAASRQQQTQQAIDGATGKSTASSSAKSLDAKQHRLRQDVVRPFRALLQFLHRNLPGEQTHALTEGGSTWSGSHADAPDSVQRQAQPSSSSNTTAQHPYDAVQPSGSIYSATLLQHHPSTLPLLWKQAAPLLSVWQHLLEVLQSEALVLTVGTEYCLMLLELLKWPGYTAQLTSNGVVDLSDRLLGLLERVEYEQQGVVNSNNNNNNNFSISADDGSVYAEALGRLFSLSIIPSAFIDDDGCADTALPGSPHYNKQRMSHVAARLQAIVHSRLMKPSQALKVEAHCLRTLTRLMRSIQHDYPQVARAPVELVKHISDFFLLPLTFRKETWRLATIEFLTVAMSLAFSQVLGRQVPLDVARAGSKSHPADDHGGVHQGGEHISESVTSPDMVKLLHETVLPLALQLFSQSRHDYSFASRRELFYFPCVALQDLFNFGAVVFYLACATSDDYAATTSDQQHRDARPHKVLRGAEHNVGVAHHVDVREDENGGEGNSQLGHSKRPRSEANRCGPSETLLHLLRSAFFVGAADAAMEQQPAVIDEISSDAPLYLLHLVAHPGTVLHFSQASCDVLVERVLLVLLNNLGSRVGSVIVAAMHAAVGGCSPVVQQQLFAWLTQRYLPLSSAAASGVTSEETVLSKETIYPLLSRLANCALVGGWSLWPSMESERDKASFAWSPALYFHRVVSRSAANLQARGARIAASRQRDDAPVQVSAGRLGNALTSATSVQPSQVAAMASFMAQYEAWSMWRGYIGGESSTSSVAWGHAARQQENAQKGFEFICTCLLHECSFFTFPRQSASAGSIPLCALQVKSEKEADAFSRTLETMETFARTLCATLSLDKGRGAAGDGKVVEALRGSGASLDEQRVRRWHAQCVHNARRVLSAPSSSIPQIAAEAAESHWLLLGTEETSASHEDTQKESEDEGALRDTPDSFTHCLAISVRRSFDMFRQRVQLSLEEALRDGAPSSDEMPRQGQAAAQQRWSDFDKENNIARRRETAAAEVDEEALSQQQVTLCVQAVQLTHWLLRLYRAGMWQAPGGQPSLNATHQNSAEMDDGGRDEHVLSTTPELFADVDHTLGRLSPQGQIYYTVLWLCDYIAARLLRGSLITYAPLLRALQHLYRHVGLSLLSTRFACAEPRQVILRMSGCILRRLHENGLKGLSSWRPSNTTSLDVAPAVHDALHLSIDVMHWIMWSAGKTGVLLMSVDPLIDIGEARASMVKVLQDNSLLSKNERYAETASTATIAGPLNHGTRPGEISKRDEDLLASMRGGPAGAPSAAVASAASWDDVDKPNPYVPFLLPVIDTVMNFLCMLRFVYKDRGAERSSRALLRTLFIRFRYCFMPGVFNLIRRPTRYALDTQQPADGQNASLSSCLFETLFLERVIDQLVADAATGLPITTPKLQCSMLSAVFHLLPSAEASVAEKLGKFSFEYLSRKKAVYVVRRHTASQVWVLFARFTHRAESVLHELLFRCREGILSRNWLLCATSLLALAEASQTAPWLESRIIYILLECWATRGFVFRSLIIECLQRMTGIHHTSATTTEKRTESVPDYARLCCQHVRQLMYWWVSKDKHPIAALPVECFGVDSADKLIANHWETILPMAIMLMHGEDGEMESASAELLHHVARVHSSECALTIGSVRRSNQGERGTSQLVLHALVHGFPHIVAQLSLFARTPSRESAALTTRRSGGGHQPHGRTAAQDADLSPDVSRAAERALYWLEQTINHAKVDDLRASWQSLGTRSRTLLSCEPVWGQLQHYKALLSLHADTVLCYLTDLVGINLPYGSDDVLLDVANSVADKIFSSGSTGRQPKGSEDPLRIRAGRHENCDNALDSFLGQHSGQHVYILLQYIYASISHFSEQPIVESGSSASQPLLSQPLLLEQKLTQWTFVCRHWLCRQSFSIPHVLQSVVSMCSHMLLTERHEEQKHACDVLLHVWPIAIADCGADGALRRQRVGHVDTALAANMLALAPDVPLVASTWSALCRCDPALGENDWELLRTRYATEASQVGAANGLVDVDNEEDDGGCAPRKGTHIEYMLPMLERVQHVAGVAAVSFFRELSRAVDSERSGFVQCICQAAATGGDFERRVSDVCRRATVSMLTVAMPSGSGLLANSSNSAATAVPSTTVIAASTTQQNDVLCSAMELLRSLAWCFIEAGEGQQLHEEVNKSTYSAGKEGASLGALLGSAYAQLQMQLYRCAFHTDAAVASLSAEALSSWFEHTRGAAPALAKENRTSWDPLVTSLIDEYTRNNGEEQLSTRAFSPFQAYAGALSWWSWNRACRVNSNSAIEGAEYPKSLLDIKLWEMLSVHRSEWGFLSCFVLASIHHYRLHERISFLAACTPLLVHEVSTRTANRNASDSLGASLLPIVLTHIMLLKESEAQRDVRAQWSERLHAYVLRQAASFPAVARLLLRSIDMCRSVIITRIRTAGLKGFQAPPPRAGRKTVALDLEHPAADTDAPQDNYQFGAVPVIKDMRDVYWLSDIPARSLALAAVEVQEPHLARLFLDISGESLLAPRGGIPAALMSSGYSRPGAADDAAQFNVDGTATTTFSILFPWARREEFSRDAKSGSAQRAVGSRRGQERHEEVQQKLQAFRKDIECVVHSAEGLLSLDRSGLPPPPIGEEEEEEERDCGEDNAKSRTYALDVSRPQDISIERVLRLADGESGNASLCRDACREKVQVLLDMGLQQSAMEMLLGSSSGATLEWSADSQLRSVAAEAAWRCSQWYSEDTCITSGTSASGISPHIARTIIEKLCGISGDGAGSNDVAFTSGSHASFHESVLHALLAIKHKEGDSVPRHLRSAQIALTQQLRPLHWMGIVIAAEALRDIRDCSDNLLMSPAEERASPSPRWLRQAPNTRSSPATPQGEHRRWLMLDEVRLSLCQLRQEPLWTRAQVMESSVRALRMNQPHRAEQWLLQYRHQYYASGQSAALSAEDQIDLCLLYARTLYAMGRTYEAVNVLQGQPCRDSSSSSNTAALFMMPMNVPLVPRVVRQLLEWSHELQLAPLSQLVRDPFLSKTSAADMSGSSDFALARLCHVLATDITTRLHTYEYQQLRQSIKDSVQLHSELAKRRQNDGADLTPEQQNMIKRRMRALEKDIALEEGELKRELQSYSLYRRSALNSYGRYLYRSGSNSDEDIQAAFGFTQLWLQADEDLSENAPASTGVSGQQPTASLLDNLLRKALDTIPTQKFLPLFGQLAAQLGSTDANSERLTHIVERIAMAHPAETIWPLLALCNGQHFGASKESSAMHVVDTDKVAAATRIVQLMRHRLSPPEGSASSSKVTISAIATDANRLSQAYLELAAYHPPAADSGRAHHINAQFRILTDISNLSIPPPTTPGGPDAATVVKYQPTFTTPGGINIPKVLRCELSDGSVVRQLLKANDDLRQDALIEQVFEMSNRCFARDERTASLHVYSYAVVPLAPTVGVVQWVDHTIPFGEYLTGTGGHRPGDRVGAHERYFPGEPSALECRAKLTEAKGPAKHQTLLTIYGEFTPALHYFLLENFLDAQQWLQAQQAYTSSVAASSVVGYIVGLGDRHASNLLLHQRTAEVVHIDLGIAFDQNKLLPIPEMVPFRLTRNIVDAMGVRGTLGSFQRDFQESMRVLRANRELLLSVLSTFIHDPLARWLITAAGNGSPAAEPHLEQNSTVNSESRVLRPRHHRASAAEAQRTLARVQAKLTGLDGSEQLSVATQTQKLLQLAQDTENLSAMFVGWSPWL